MDSEVVANKSLRALLCGLVPEVIGRSDRIVPWTVDAHVCNVSINIDTAVNNPPHYC